MGQQAPRDCPYRAESSMAWPGYSRDLPQGKGSQPGTGYDPPEAAHWLFLLGVKTSRCKFPHLSSLMH